MTRPVLPDLPFGAGGSTSAPSLVPDLGPGQGQARDAALDAAAREGMAPLAPAGPSESEQQAAADLDASIAEARERSAAQGFSNVYVAYGNLYCNAHDRLWPCPACLCKEPLG